MARNRAPPSPKPKKSVAEEIERKAEQKLVASARDKYASGDRPTARELAALRRFEKQESDLWQRAYLHRLPKRLYLEIVGRQANQLNDQCRRFGMPLSGPEVNLMRFLPWVHDYFRDHRRQLEPKPENGDGTLFEGADGSPALERYREERAKLAALDRLEREGQLLPRDAIHEVLTRMAAVLRSAGESLKRQFGDEAHALLDEALDDVEQDIETFFGNHFGGSGGGEMGGEPGEVAP